MCKMLHTNTRLYTNNSVILVLHICSLCELILEELGSLQCV
jgi:hypothetical protein